MTAPAPFVAAIRAHPGDDGPRLVLRDHLMEHGHWSEPALRALVLAHRKEDWPRLCYADWCGGEGQGERAEFIRVQCELARLVKPGCECDRTTEGRTFRRCPAKVYDERKEELQRRERELLAVHPRFWEWAEPVRGILGVSTTGERPPVIELLAAEFPVVEGWELPGEPAQTQAEGWPADAELLAGSTLPAGTPLVRGENGLWRRAGAGEAAAAVVVADAGDSHAYALPVRPPT